MKQLHKKFNDCQVKDLMARYLKKKIEREEIQKVLDIKKTRFFALVKRLKDDPENFSVSYFRSIPTRTTSKDIETNIIKELNTEKDLIQAKEVPIKCYNYSYIKDILRERVLPEGISFYYNQSSKSKWLLPFKTRKKST
jgi:hypothetical protein